MYTAAIVLRKYTLIQDDHSYNCVGELATVQLLFLLGGMNLDIILAIAVCFTWGLPTFNMIYNGVIIISHGYNRIGTIGFYPPKIESPKK